MSNVIRELVQCIVTILTIGPVKVFLDVKRGETSLSDIQAEFQEEQYRFHQRLGVAERQGMFPDRDQGPRRRRTQAEEGSSNDTQY